MDSLSGGVQRPPNAAIRLTSHNEAAERKCSKCVLAEWEPFKAEARGVPLQEAA